MDNNIITPNDQHHPIINTNMNKGIIYFVQPAELVGTKRFKIGCSKASDLNRCKTGYRKGTRYVCIMECSNPLALERKIKLQFGKSFTLVAGREYFEGDEKVMLDTFVGIFNEHESMKDE